MEDETNKMLQETINDHLDKFKYIYENSGDMHVTQKQEICKMTGNLKLLCGPYWSYVLEDQSYQLPCIIIDTAKHIQKLIQCNDCLVEVTSGYLIIECYKHESLTSDFDIYLQFYPSDMILLKKKFPYSWVMPVLSIKKIHVVHVTTPIVKSDSLAFCLMLVIVKSEGDDSRCLWILLKDKQVLWHIFLIPNRDYIIQMMESDDYFKKTAKPLRVILAKVKAIPIFREILHHPEMYPTSTAVEMPVMSSILMCSSSGTEQLRHNFSSAWWHSISEAICYDESPMVSLWGQVVNVSHRETKDRDGCSLCVKPRHYCQKNICNTVSQQVKQIWTNPWETKFTADDPSPVELPVVNESYNIISGKFIPEKVTKVVTLRDILSGITVLMYVKKRSFHQYLGLFTSGNILSAKFLHKRISAKGFTYFVTTALTSFEIVHVSDTIRDDASSSPLCGFPHINVEPGKIVWGTLDMWTLLKVRLTYEKKYKGDVTSSAAVKAFVATATVQLHRHSGNCVTVVMKNDHVKELLQVPNDIWCSFAVVCKQFPLSYDYRDESPQDRRCLSGIFSMLCGIRNLKKNPFLITCKLLPRISNHDDMYFCTSIRYTDPQRYFLKNVARSV